MNAPTSIARSLYRWCALLALPGGLWTALEMYGLTMGGPQMLFFSISHTLAPMVLAVFLSFPTGLLWLAQTLAALAHLAYRAKVGVPTPSLAIFAVTLVTHTAALWTYESWSYVPALRVGICSVGLVFSGIALREAWRQLRQVKSQLPATASEA